MRVTWEFSVNKTKLTPLYNIDLEGFQKVFYNKIESGIPPMSCGIKWRGGGNIPDLVLYLGLPPGPVRGILPGLVWGYPDLVLPWGYPRSCSGDTPWSCLRVPWSCLALGLLPGPVRGILPGLVWEYPYPRPASSVGYLQDRTCITLLLDANGKK